jgi:hypothetical protein
MPPFFGGFVFLGVTNRYFGTNSWYKKVAAWNILSSENQGKGIISG